MYKKVTNELIGWYGAVAVLGAYVLLTLDYFSAGMFWYQFLNFSGAIALIYSSFIKKDYQPMALNLVWAFVALLALAEIF